MKGSGAALAVCLGVTSCASAPPDSMVIVESRGTQRVMLMENVDMSLTSYTWGDRRSVETAGKKGDRVIVALDRGRIWTVRSADSSYSELTLEQAKELAELTPSPRKVSEKSLGAGPKIAGLDTRRFELRYEPSREMGMADSAEFIHEVWIGHGTSAVDRILSFNRRSSATTTGLQSGSLDLALRQRGVPVKERIRIALPGARNIASSDPEGAKKSGIDPEDGSMLVVDYEVVSIKMVPVRRSLFEPPKGWAKKPADELEILETMKGSGSK